MMLNTFFHRNCAGFQSNNLTDPCQSFLDLALIFVIAVGAGLTLSDERIAVIGFVFVHLLASTFFVIAVAAPPFFGLNDPVITQTILGSSLLTALRYAFPFALFSSFLGSIIGLYLEDRLRLSEARPISKGSAPIGGE